MPRGYRYAILALVGLLTAASPPRQRPAGEQAQAERQIGKRPSNVAASLQKANEPDAPDPGCPQGEDNRKSDLCAQWKAADAAAEGTIWTERAFYLGAVGLVVGLLTLAAAGAAAKYARDAARETKRGADAAENAITETRRIGETQTRAYLSIKKLEGLKDARGVTLRAMVVNTGQSPAMVNNIRLRLEFGLKDHLNKAIDVRHHVSAGGRRKLAPLAFPDSNGRPSTFKVHAEIFYEDAFGISRFTQADFVGRLSEKDSCTLKFMDAYQMAGALLALHERGEIEF